MQTARRKKTMRTLQRFVAMLGATAAMFLAAPELIFGQQKPNPAASQSAPAKATATTREPGLYVTFQTDMGDIPCKLYENEAPLTVRKIVGLAMGRLSYVDPVTKKTVKKPLYDGLIFHRVIPGFMIQGGDPLGTGMGGPTGPGFPFKDEFVDTLKFDVPGRLAMANAGPGTNGSQFFITEVPTAHLNGRHTIFGQCSNVELVKQIARVPAGPENRPRTPVHIKHVVVERVGPAPANAPEGPASGRATGAPAKGPSKAPGTVPRRTPRKAPAKQPD
jgi:peptidyl-prolyl cis-trans isomerase A (cyclophilin A)